MAQPLNLSISILNVEMKHRVRHHQPKSYQIGLKNQTLLFGLVKFEYQNNSHVDSDGRDSYLTT